MSKSRQRTNGHIQEAAELYKTALQEFRRARSKQEVRLARNASGKAWLAVVEALNGFLVNKGISEENLPKNERGRHYLLTRYGTRDMRQLYDSAYGGIHQRAYYDGLVEFRALAERLADVRRFLTLAKKKPSAATKH